MKRFFSSIFVVTTLLLAPGCSSNTKSTETQVSPSIMTNHDEHSMENMNHENNSQITTKFQTYLRKLAIVFLKRW